MQLLISDDHPGLRAARRAVFPSLKWQRCQFHMAQNAQSYAPKKSMRIEVGEVMRDLQQPNSRNGLGDEAKGSREVSKERSSIRQVA